MLPIPPSGRQHRIHHDRQEAVITEVGGGLRRYAIDRVEVLDGYAEDEICPGARGAALLPWPNRLEDGRYQVHARVEQLPLTEPERHNAIHGLTRWMSWEAREQRDDRVLMAVRLHPQPGYPFTLDLEIAYQLSPEGLSVKTTAQNLGLEPAPYGAGHHPYVALGTAPVEDLWLKIPAASRLETDSRLNATGRRISLAGTAYDFRAGRVLKDLVLDTAYADFQRDPDGIARVELKASGRLTTLWLDAGYSYLMVFTENTRGPSGRRRSLALEPMTCGPNAFRLPQLGLRMLAPGERFSSSWGLTV